jgi:hypothetical protein
MNGGMTEGMTGGHDNGRYNSATQLYLQAPIIVFTKSVLQLQPRLSTCCKMPHTQCGTIRSIKDQSHSIIQNGHWLKEAYDLV